jgi:tetratricopeptide (TPR) repeat protein
MVSPNTPKIREDSYQSNMEYLEHLAARDSKGFALSDFWQYFKHLGDGLTRGAQAGKILDKEMTNLQEFINNDGDETLVLTRLKAIAEKLLQDKTMVRGAAHDGWEHFSHAGEVMKQLTTKMEGQLNRPEFDQLALVTQLFSDDVELLSKNGQAFLDAGLYEQAFICFKRVSDFAYAGGELYNQPRELYDEALVRLGDLYSKGWGTTKSPKEALHCYQRANDHGYIWGKAALANVYTQNHEDEKAKELIDTLKSNGYPTEMLKMYKRSLPHSVKAAVENCQSVISINRSDVSLVLSAIALLKFLAQQNLPNRELALFELAKIYESGLKDDFNRDILKPDRTEAARYLAAASPHTHTR